MKAKKRKPIKIVYLTLVVFLVLNIVYLGATGSHVISGDNISEFASERGKKSTTEYANRGQIYTADGESVATNVKKYKIIAILSNNRPGYGKTAAYVTDISDTAQKIASVLGSDASIYKDQMQKAVDAGKYQIEFGSAGREISTTQKNQIEEMKLSGIEFSEYNGRYYPYGDFCSYMIGYTNSYENKGVNKLVGQLGLELKYNKTLAGKNGYKVYQIDKDGYTLPNGVLASKTPVNGEEIHLTINSSLQRDLDLMMNNAVTGTKAEFGTCSVMEVKTGKILAVSSYPSFNPNDRKITNYTNYFTDATYECGSVFKPFVYATSIEAGTYSHEKTYNSGTFPVTSGGKIVATIRDHNNGQGWGSITYDQGLFHSSNVAICNMLSNGMVNKDNLKKNLKALGFFQVGSLDGIKTSNSVSALDKSDSYLEYLTTGFGQGSTVTAYQLLKAYSVFGNNGKTVEPYIVDRVVNTTTNKVTYTGKTKYSKQIFSENTIKEMKDLMLGVVEDSSGTGKTYKMDDIRIFGKTGTGQVAGSGGYRSDIAMHSFACLAPYDDPKVVLYITLKCSNDYANYTPDIVKTMIKESLQIINSYDTGNTITTSMYTVDNFTNQSTTFVQNKLTSKGMNVVSIGDGSTIIDQSPSSNTKITSGSRVFIKTDGANITIPNMTGYSVKEINTFASLSGINITTEGNGKCASSQSVAEGTVMKAGDSLTITLGE
jgi:penicillin-binding protein 2B